MSHYDIVIGVFFLLSVLPPPYECLCLDMDFSFLAEAISIFNHLLLAHNKTIYILNIKKNIVYQPLNSDELIQKADACFLQGLHS